MAANSSDKISQVANGGVPAPAVVQADRPAGSTTLTLDTTQYWPITSGIKFVTYRKDATGKKLAGSQADWAGVVSGNTVTNLRKTSAGTDTGNLSGDIAVMMPTAAWGTEMADGFLAQHKNPSGAHSNVTADSVSTTTLAVTTNATVAGTLTVAGKDIANLTPAGSMMMFAAAAAPTGWLICDGSAVNRVTYATLFSAISTTYGAGDGTTTFNLPNFNGKAPFGKDAAQTEFSTLATTGGQKSVQSHSHGISDPGHRHAMWSVGQEANSYPLSGPSTRVVLIGGNPDAGNGVTGLSGTGVSVQASGAGANNLNPYLTVNFIIKT